MIAVGRWPWSSAMLRSRGGLPSKSNSKGVCKQLDTSSWLSIDCLVHQHWFFGASAFRFGASEVHQHWFFRASVVHQHYFFWRISGGAPAALDDWLHQQGHSPAWGFRPRRRRRFDVTCSSILDQILLSPQIQDISWTCRFGTFPPQG